MERELLSYPGIENIRHVLEALRQVLHDLFKCLVQQSIDLNGVWIGIVYIDGIVDLL